VSAPDPPRVRGTSRLQESTITRTDRRSLRPALVASTTALVSLALLVVAVRLGWLGADVGRGAEFCEVEPTGLIRQPANTLSNLGFVLAGLAVGWYAGLPRGRLARRGLATSYAVVVVLLGPGSMAMHASQSELGGRLDQFSMYVLAGFAAAYAGIRLSGRGVGTFVAALVALVALCDLVGRAGTLPVVNNAGNAAFTVVLVVAVVLEVRLRRRSDRPAGVAWIVAALTTMAVAFAVWTLSRSGAPLCDPHSWVQGHAVWHLLCAVAAYCLYRYWTTEPEPASGQERAEPAL
jgi:hypothetical protein